MGSMCGWGRGAMPCGSLALSAVILIKTARWACVGVLGAMCRPCRDAAHAVAMQTENTYSRSRRPGAVTEKDVKDMY